MNVKNKEAIENMRNSSQARQADTPRRLIRFKIDEAQKKKAYRKLVALQRRREKSTLINEIEAL